MSGSDDNLDRESRILAAASRLIVHFGYDKTTVSDIANEAGVSKGAIYLHWKSKDELFGALIFHEAEKLLEDMLARMEADPDVGSIFSLYQHAMVATVANPLMHAVMTTDVRVLGDFNRRWGASRFGGEGDLFRHEMVKQLQAANVIRADLDSHMIAYILTLIRYGFLTVHQVVPYDQSPPLDEVGKALGLMLERALAPEGGGDKEAGKQTLLHIIQNMQEMVRRYKGEKQD